MKVSVLGSDGSIGRRHVNNLLALGVEVNGYDLAHNQTRESVIQDSDAIVIATPTSQHSRDMADCLVAGKHIFVEKPIAHTIDVLLSESLAVAKHGKRVVFIGNNLRYHSCVQAARAAMGAGVIGKPLWASITVGQHTVKEPYLRDGVTLNWGAHEIDLALHLLGPATVRTACVDSADTIADFVLDHSNGCRSVVHLDYVTNPEIRATTIIGTLGQITIDLKQRWSCLTMLDGSRQEMTGSDSWSSNYMDEMKGFLARCQGHNDGVGATGEDGLATLQIIEAVKAKAKE